MSFALAISDAIFGCNCFVCDRTHSYMYTMAEENLLPEEEDDILSEPEDYAAATEDGSIPYAVLSRKRAREEDKCFGCIFNFGPARRPGKDLALEGLWQEFEANVGTMGPEQLAKHLQIIFQETIYEPQTDLGVEIPYWEVDDIVAHFRTHIKHPRFLLQDSLVKTSLFVDEVSDHVIQAGGKVSESHMKSFISLVTLQSKLVHEAEKLAK